MIGLCSDIHDNIWALERALPLLAPAQVVVFCGDFCAPFTLGQLAEGVYILQMLVNNQSIEKRIVKGN